MKEEFIYGLNDAVLTEIIRELTKNNEKTLVTSEQVLVWAKRIKAQRG